MCNTFIVNLHRVPIKILKNILTSKVGYIDFYGKSGFDYASKFGIRYHGLSEDDDASFFLLKEFKEGYLSGITGEYATPKGYFAACDNPKDFEKYESSFPFKEKLKLPGQLF